jgi:hypothetical protein
MRANEATPEEIDAVETMVNGWVVDFNAIVEEATPAV